MSPVEPYEHADQQDASQERAGEFIVARCDRTIMLQCTAEALDEITFTMEREVGGARLLPVGLGGDDRRDFAFFERGDQRVGIVALVSEQCARLDPLQQRLGLRNIGDLPRRQRKGNGIAKGIGNSVDLGRQAAARAPDGLVFAVFF